MQLTLRDLLNTIFRYSRHLILFWVSLSIALLIFVSQTKKQYDSTAKILVSLGVEAQGRAEYLNGKNLQLLQRDQQLHNEQQILESHDVLLTTAKWIVGDTVPGSVRPAEDDLQLKRARKFVLHEEPEPTFLLRTSAAIVKIIAELSAKPKTHDEQLEDIVRELSKSLSVKAIFDSDALDVSFRYGDSHVAQTILRLLIAAYLDHHIAVFQSATESAMLASQLDRSVETYQARLGDLSSYMTSHHVYNDEAQVNLLLDERGRIQQALNEALAERNSVSARLVALNGMKPSVQTPERYSTIVVRNKLHDDLAARLSDETIAKQSLLSRHPVGSRAYSEEQIKLDELHRQVESAPEQVTDRTEDRRSKASELVESESISLSEAQRGADARIKQLWQSRIDMDNKLTNYAKDLVGFDSLKLAVAFARQGSEQLSQASVDSRLRTLTSQNAITDISLLDGPTWDPHPTSPTTQVVLAAAAALLVFGSAATILALISLDTTVADGKTAALRLGVRVVSTFPLSLEATSLTASPHSFAAEHHREFARIYQSIRGDSVGGKVILISESNAREGGSLLGYGLAEFLAVKAYQKAAFVDTTTHPISDAESSTSVRKSGPTIIPWPHGRQDSPDSTTSAISFLDKLRHGYDYVVVSTGAVKDATDLLTISEVVTSTFLIVEAGRTRRAAALYSLDTLRTYGFNNVSVILNKRLFYVPAWLMRFV